TTLFRSGKITAGSCAATPAASRCAGKQRLFVRLEAAFGGAEQQRRVVRRSSEEVDNAGECVDTMQRGAGAFENLDGVHAFEGDGEVEVVVRGLAVVDAESVEQDERLLEAAAAEDEIGLRTAGPALLEEDRGVLAQEIERGFGGQRFLFQGQHDYGTGRLREGDRRGRAQHHHGFRSRGNGGGRRSGWVLGGS